jgi:hypothetical protein
MFSQKVPIFDAASGQMVRPRGLIETPAPKGIIQYELWRGCRIVTRNVSHNAVNNTAKNMFLDAMFNNGTRYNSWYIGLVDGGTFTGFSASDTISPSGRGWTEYTAYAVSSVTTTRAHWVYAGSASSQQLTNASACIFDFNGVSITSVYGIFITADPTKSGTGAPLWSTGAFTAPLSVLGGDQLRVTYTIQL